MTVRSITDGDGGQWRVTYIHPAIVRPTGERYRVLKGCFCFTAADGRCVCTPRELFAGDWRRVSARELRDLLCRVLEERAGVWA